MFQQLSQRQRILRLAADSAPSAGVRSLATLRSSTPWAFSVKSRPNYKRICESATLVAASDPVLHQRALTVPSFRFARLTLADALFRVAKEHRPLGLAAPQLGLSSRAMLMSVPDSILSQGLERVGILPRDPSIPELGPRDAFVLFNPKILRLGKEQDTMYESCLSLPGEMYPVKRYGTIGVAFEKWNGERVTAVMKGLEARVFQHELDHLNGVLISQRFDREYVEDLPPPGAEGTKAGGEGSAEAKGSPKAYII